MWRKESTVWLLAAALAAGLAACDKEKAQDVKPAATGPEVTLKSGGAYVAHDTVVGPNVRLLLGVRARQREEPLQEYTFRQRTSAGPDSVLSSSLLSGPDQSSYDRDEQILTGKVAAVTTYTFTLRDAAGQTGTASVRVTVE